MSLMNGDLFCVLCYDLIRFDWMCFVVVNLKIWMDGMWLLVLVAVLLSIMSLFVVCCLSVCVENIVRKKTLQCNHESGGDVN